MKTSENAALPKVKKHDFHHEFERLHRKTERRYAELGMDRHAIEAITAYDYEAFYRTRLQELLVAPGTDIDEEWTYRPFAAKAQANPFTYGFNDRRLEYLWTHESSVNKRIMVLIAYGYTAAEIGKILHLQRRRVYRQIEKMKKNGNDFAGISC